MSSGATPNARRRSIVDSSPNGTVIRTSRDALARSLRNYEGWRAGSDPLTAGLEQPSAVGSRSRNELLLESLEQFGEIPAAKRKLPQRYRSNLRQPQFL
jgi:hypothetical protein